MSRVSIRRALPADALALSALAADTFPLACPPGTTEDNIRGFFERNLSEEAFRTYLSKPNYRLWLATTESDVVGYAMAIHGEPADPNISHSVVHRPTMELSKLYVRLEGHGGGIALSLLNEATDEATERGCQSVWLGVNQQNERANRFYAKNGFEIVGTRQFQVGESLESDFVRERPLEH